VARDYFLKHVGDGYHLGHIARMNPDLLLIGPLKSNVLFSLFSEMLKNSLASI